MCTLLLVKERHKQVFTLKLHSYTFCFFFVFSGGYTVGPKPLIELLRQRSRPYLFSNSLPPPVVACATRAVELLLASSEIAQSMTAKTMRYLVPGLKCNRTDKQKCWSSHLPTLLPQYFSIFMLQNFAIQIWPLIVFLLLKVINSIVAPKWDMIMVDRYF